MELKTKFYRNLNRNKNKYSNFAHVGHEARSEKEATDHGPKVGINALL